MSAVKDGGPAFPRPASTDENANRCNIYNEQDGMSLRDYFAAKAMQGLIASNDECAGDRISDIPAYAYQIADAMVSEREKTP